jgi:uncharacterized protein with beta-barrel porin domain
LIAQAQLDGSPQYGVTVNWSVLSGSAVLGAASSMTDESGNASVSVTLGATAGPIVIRGERADAPGVYQDYHLSATSPRLTLIKPTSPPSGDGQSGQTGAALPLPLIAQAQLDGSPQYGVTVNWSVLSGSAVLGAASSMTDESGNASVNVTLGATAGPIVIRGERADAPGVYQDYHLKSFGVVLTLVKPHDVVSGDGQSGGPGSSLPKPLIAQAQMNGQRQSGVVVNWAVLSGSATLSAASSITDGIGNAAISVTLGNTPGPVTIRASRADEPSAIQDYTVTVVATPPPPPVNTLDYDTPANGAGSVPVDQSLALSVRAAENGSPPESATIYWRTNTPVSSSVSPSSQTVGDGLSTTQFTASATGTYLVSACWDPSGDLADCFVGGLVKTFTVTVTAGTGGGNTLSMVSGDDQSGLVGTHADSPLVVRLTNSDNQPVFDETINWEVVSGSATLDANSGLTDENGQVQIGFSFGANAGPIVIRASTSSATAVDFNATALAPGLVILSGNGQSAAPGASLPADFVVQVVLPAPAAIASNGHATSNLQSLSGVPIQWQVSSGGGSLTQTTSFTDSSGHASNHLTLGSSAGTNTVLVTAPGGASTTFTATATIVTTTATLSIVSGNSQSLVPNSASAPLVVALTDSEDNPVANAVIHWTGSNATLSGSTSTTDANGRASITAYVTAAGAATVSASSTSPAADPVTFNLDAGLSKIPGLTPQQLEIANALDNACPALGALENRTPAQQDLYLRCQDLAEAAGTNPGQVLTALDQLFANIAFVQSSAAQLISDAQFTNIKTRIAALRSGTNGSSFGGLALSGPNGSFPIGLAANSMLGLADAKDKKDKEIGSDFDRWGFFAAGTFGRGNADPRSVVPGYSFQTNGITAGVDYRYSDSLIFGVTAGYAKYGSNLDSGGGNLDTTGWSLSAYSTLYRQNSWYVDGVFTFGHNSFDISRHIFYRITTNAGTTTIDQQAQSSSSGDSLAGAFTLGRDFQKGPLSFGPYLRGTYTRLSFGNANETLVTGLPGNGLGLAIKSRDLTSDAVVVGGKVTFATSHDWGVLIPHMQFEWEHEFQNDPNHLEAHFLADPTATPIVVHGNTIDTDFGRLGFGLSFILTGGRSGFVYYEKTLGRDGITQDNLALGIRLEF